ncbi:MULTISPECIES: tryptophan 7-halogenase [unclassified Anabaena]|uniref:tryptophan 7-halogenase n=1 Tax=unclassified Anabaena TaxID=2619674 RepID=UPI0008320C5E|nr:MULTISPECIES: tryptophan 7-halogenase [unclassified Anabaena]
MKIAVIGGGTAGYIAASHISKHFPQFDLYHIYDSTIPSIGVGEGTTPYFLTWLDKITNLSYEQLEKRCHITRKFGISFENWGVEHEKFFHHFYPVGQGYAYHISAVEIVNLLKEHVCATEIDSNVIDLQSNGISVKIILANNTNLEVDLAIDARGFPQSFDENYIKLSWIPTNRALIRQVPGIDDHTIDLKIGSHAVKYQTATRSIARPHGWIFTIPLTNRTSYGYIYNRDISSVSEIETDFDKFFQAEGITYNGQAKQVNFPNFTVRNCFDGALFKIGNSASFLEPLEATAIGCILKQVEAISHWVLRSFAKLEKRERLDESQLIIFNQYFLNYVYKMSLFVGWHYAMGSRFNTKFWEFAEANFYQEIENLENKTLLEKFYSVLELAQRSPHPIDNFLEFSSTVAETETNIVTALIKGVAKLYGQWTQPSFTEVGYGIGYFS